MFGRFAYYQLAMRALGKNFQFAGLVVLPLAILLELTGILGDEFGLKEMLIAMCFGIAAFYLGRLIEGYAT